MKASVAVLAGDGIGPEVMREALAVLAAVATRFGHRFELREAAVGGAAFDLHGAHLPAETIRVCRASDAVLFGSVGGPLSESHLPKWDGCETKSILALRKEFGFHANLRPVKVFPELAHLGPLKPEIIGAGVDLLVVRELCGDLYFGEHRTGEREGIRFAIDVAEYDEHQVRRVAEVAFSAARARRRHVTSVHKANVLDTSKLWKTVVAETHRRFPDVTLDELLVDNCAMRLVLAPASFDVILTSNMFGDILSDEASVLPGSLGVTPSASLSPDGPGLYEPAGGSAPDIAGRGIANPTAQILSVAMMLRHSFGLEEEAREIEEACRRTVASGVVTKDLAGGGASATTAEFGAAVTSRLLGTE